MAITNFNAKNGLSVGTNSTNVIDSSGNATFATAMTTGSLGVGTNYSATARLLISGSSTASDTTAIIRAGVVSPLGGAGVLNVQNSAGTSILFVSSSGNIGIGTTIPGYALDISPTTSTARLGSALVGAWPANTTYAFFGHNSLSQASSGNYALTQNSSGATFLNAASGNSLYLRINDADALVVGSDRNVGIGTFVPTSKLTVFGSASTTSNVVYIRESQPSADGYAILRIQNSNGDEILYASGSGNVGIGTATPGRKLDVSGVIRSIGTTGTSSPTLELLSLGAWTWGIRGDGQSLLFLNDSNERMRLLAGGTLGLTGSFEPGNNLLYDLGSATKRWRNVFASNISGSLTGSGLVPSQVIFAGTGGALTGTNVFTYDGNLTLSGTLRTVYSVGDEGGEIFFMRPQTNSTINTGVNIDVYQNRVRIFESGGTNRGGYFDISTLGAGVSTNLAAGSGTPGGSDTQVQFNDGGTFAGNANFTFTKSANLLRIANISGSLTGSGLEANSVVFAGTGGVLTGSLSRLNFNPSTGNLGVNYNTPMYTLDVGGSANVRGILYAQNGSITNTLTSPALSGSLTKLSDGSSFLIAGTNIAITTGSSGAVTVATTGVPTGTGTANYAAKWSSTSALTTSQIYDDGTGVGIGTTNVGYKFQVLGNSYFSGNTFTDGLVYGYNFGGLDALASDIRIGVFDGYGVNIGFGTTGANIARFSSGLVTVSGSLVPGLNNTYNIGSPSLRWANVYATSISGSLTGSNVSAGQVVVAGTGGVLSGSNNFTWSNANGRVGIGSASPDRTLIVRGSASTIGIYNTDASAGSMSIDAPIASGFAQIDVQGAFALRFNSNSTERMRISAAGDVGIGTGTYTGRFYVSGSSSPATPTAVIREGVVSPLGGAGALDVQNSAGTSLLFVSGSNRVGIGTNVPVNTLDVRGVLGIGTGDVAARNAFTITTSVGGGPSATADFAFPTTTFNDTLNFKLSQSGGGYGQFNVIFGGTTIFQVNGGSLSNNGNIVLNPVGNTFFSNGNVGIGISVTSDKLAVNGAMSVTGSALPGTDNLYDLGSASKRWRNVFAANISGSLTGSNILAGQVVVAGTGGVLSGSNNFVWDTVNTRVGIGTSTPSYSLDVFGNVRISGNFLRPDGAGSALQLGNGTEQHNQDTYGFYNAIGNTTFAILNSTGLGLGTTPTARLLVSGSSTASTPTAVIREGVVSATGGVGVLNVQNSAGTSLFFVSGSGNVGIGITNPTLYKLDVVGQIKSRNLASGDTTGITLGNNGSERARIQFTASDDSARFKMEVLGVNGATERLSVFAGPIGGVASNEAFVIGGNGNVGIGTGTLVTARLLVTGSGATSSTTTAHFVNSSGTSLLLVRDDGNVGIGSASPSQGLDLVGTSTGVFGARIRNTSTGIGAYSVLYMGDTNAALLRNSSGNTAYAGADSLSLYTLGAQNIGVVTNNVLRVLFDTSGNVGIGTGALITSRLLVTGSGATSSTSTAHFVNSSGTSILFVRDDGNVGVGSTNPGQKLHVANAGATFLRLHNTTAGYAYDMGPDASGIFTFSLSGVAQRFSIDTSGHFLPGVNNSYDLGSSGTRWRDVYARTGSFSGDVSISGNLTVAGTTTVVNSTTVSIGDNIILLNSTASPQQYGGIYVADTTANTTGSLIWDSNANMWMAGLLGSESYIPTGSGTTNYVPRWTSASSLGNSTIYDDGTNVAIGINAANSTGLTVYSAGTPTVSLKNSTSGNGSTDGFQLSTAGGDSYVWNYEAGTLRFGTNATERMRIDSGGDVGIGTGTYTGRFFISGSSSPATPTLVVREGVVSPLGGAGILNVQNSAGTSILFVSGSGNVGIRQTNPTLYNIQMRELVIGDPTLGNTGATIASGISSEGTLAFADGTSGNAAYRGYVQYSHTVDTLRLGSAGATQVSIDSSGNVGIGTSVFTDKLAVNGSMSVTGSIVPGLNNLYNLGSATKAWAAVYALTASSPLHITTAATTSATYSRIFAAGESGRVTATVDIASAASKSFTVGANNGAHLFDVSIVCSESGFSVAKKFTVATQYGATPVTFKVIDTGPYTGYDMTVAFTKPSATTTQCTITNGYTSTVNFALTIDIAATSTGSGGTTVTLF